MNPVWSEQTERLKKDEEWRSGGLSAPTVPPSSRSCPAVTQRTSTYRNTPSCRIWDILTPCSERTKRRSRSVSVCSGADTPQRMVVVMMMMGALTSSLRFLYLHNPALGVTSCSARPHAHSRNVTEYLYLNIWGTCTSLQSFLFVPLHTSACALLFVTPFIIFVHKNHEEFMKHDVFSSTNSWSCVQKGLSLFSYENIWWFSFSDVWSAALKWIGGGEEM